MSLQHSYKHFLSWSLSILFAGALSASCTAAPQKPQFALPLACKPNQNCWIVTYNDHDSTPSSTLDYNCGHRTYDGHNGIDFGIGTLEAMQQGISVLAASDGIVKGIRDGEADISAKTFGWTKGKECGNGVLVNHSDEWSTQYCHMKKGSITVKTGEVIKSGQPLGKVGLSGFSEFPHLHFTVRHQNQIIDPFSGNVLTQNCQKEASRSPLWQSSVLAKLSYQPVLIYNIGIADQMLSIDEAVAEKFNKNQLSASSPAIVLWTVLYGVEASDMLTLQIKDPQAHVLIEKSMPIQKRNARYFQFLGKKRPEKNWSPGTYQAEVTLKRNSSQVIEAKKVFQFQII
jgi:murein DD-endopeptidase MepM/ murein hydrolase activator NlpD